MLPHLYGAISHIDDRQKTAIVIGQKRMGLGKRRNQKSTNEHAVYSIAKESHHHGQWQELEANFSLSRIPFKPQIILNPLDLLTDYQDPTHKNDRFRISLKMIFLRSITKHFYRQWLRFPCFKSPNPYFCIIYISKNSLVNVLKEKKNYECFIVNVRNNRTQQLSLKNYLDDVNRIPLTPPNVDMATNTGIIHAITPNILFANSFVKHQNFLKCPSVYVLYNVAYTQGKGKKCLKNIWSYRVPKCDVTQERNTEPYLQRDRLHTSRSLDLLKYLFEAARQTTNEKAIKCHIFIFQKIQNSKINFKIMKITLDSRGNEIRKHRFIVHHFIAYDVGYILTYSIIEKNYLGGSSRGQRSAYDELHSFRSFSKQQAK
ncbi:hypothetical protein GQR58_022311 [Nymphon striatum]|nr:hypothetical protein GQR58_022311 [Nymphon striatum]